MKRALKISCLAATVAALSFNAAHAELMFDGDGWHSAHKLFVAGDQTLGAGKKGYRIPAITTTVQGALIAFGDYRDTPGNDVNNSNQVIDLAYKISYDQGETWTDVEHILSPHQTFKQITDPAVLHDPSTGKTFAFGYANNVGLGQAQSGAFYVFESSDAGKTWDQGKDIVTTATKPGYKLSFQGPGKGMYYNDTLYVGIQSWHDKNGGPDSVSGILFSTDHGKTWEASYPDGIPRSSESHVFHHQGYVYLATKDEPSGRAAKRIVYRTKDNGKNWERVYEDFFPDTAETCESSSLALSEDVYIAGYATHGIPGTLIPRKDIYLTTNKGKSILLAPDSTMGYTSLDMDEDNIYVLFEGGEKVGNMWFQRFDHASKDYANLTQQILDRSEDGQYMQDLMLTNKSYVKGSYGNVDSGVEAVYAGPLFNIGLFYKETDENSKDMYRTIEYDTKDISLAASINGLAFDNDSLFGAVQSSNIDYVNESEADVVSGMLGYQAKFNIKDVIDYKLKVLGIYSEYDFQRNNKEGIGRTADFSAYSISFENALMKTLEIEHKGDVTASAGLRSTLFGHDSFTEDGGNGWNNADVAKSQQHSHQLFAGVDFKYNIEAGQYVDVVVKTGAEFNIELADVDDYREEYTVLDVTKLMAAPIEDHTDGYAKGYVGADFIINKGATVGLYASADTDDENELRASLGWQF